MNAQKFRSWVEIDRVALHHNARIVRERARGAGLLAVVKANAYGHGMVEVAEALARDAQLFGVANVEEAVTLRAALAHPIIILGPALPQERESIVAGEFIPSVSTLTEAKEFDRAAQGRSVSICFVVDTGMGRMGTGEAKAAKVFRELAKLPNVRIHSVSTHLPVPDEDAQYTREQLASFSKTIEQLRREVPGDYKVHALPSAGVLAFSDTSFDFVRAGIMLYGISPFPDEQKLLRPVMTWKTRIALIRDLPKGSSISYGRTFIAPRPMKVATLTTGYADGYPRHLSNRGTAVLVQGRRCPLLGRVTMDLIMIDVSEVKDAEPGDEVVLMGRQGESEIACRELAERADTITWEITARVGQRVRRVFV
jgi:alanine racemase